MKKIAIIALLLTALCCSMEKKEKLSKKVQFTSPGQDIVAWSSPLLTLVSHKERLRLEHMCRTSMIYDALQALTVPKVLPSLYHSNDGTNLPLSLTYAAMSQESRKLYAIVWQRETQKNSVISLTQYFDKWVPCFVHPDTSRGALLCMRRSEAKSCLALADQAPKEHIVRVGYVFTDSDEFQGAEFKTDFSCQHIVELLRILSVRYPASSNALRALDPLLAKK